MHDERLNQSLKSQEKDRLIGTPARLVIFAWTLAMALLSPADRMLPSVGLCLLAALVFYPAAFRRLLQVRWLLLIGLPILANLLWVSLASRIPGEEVSAGDGLVMGLQMALRALVILVAVNGLCASVDIPEIAGLLERAGLHGLGFSLGVAINLLPTLRVSAANAWHSLRMRGGLRRQWKRGLRLLAITVLSNALRRGEEIALAAEARAFSPERARGMPMKAGKLDWAIAASGFIGLLIFLFLR